MKSKKSRGKRRRAFFLVPLSVLAIACVIYVLSGYWLQIFEKEEEKKFLLEQLETMKEEEIVLKKEVDKLKDEEYVARYAREKYLYSKNGEFILKID